MTLRYTPEMLLRGEIDWSGQADGKVLAWDEALGKFAFVDAGASPTAAAVSYDPTASGLVATDVQAAIDELADSGGAGGYAGTITWTIRAGNVAVLPGDVRNIGSVIAAANMAGAGTPADSASVMGVVSLTEAATVTVTVRNEVRDEVIAEISEALPAGLATVATVLSIGESAGYLRPEPQVYSATVTVSAGTLVVQSMMIICTKSVE